MSDPCPDCGRDRVLVGIRHNCNVRPPHKPPSHPLLRAGVIETDLRSRIVELEAEIERLAAKAKVDCLACKKRQAAKAKAQKKRRKAKDDQ